MTLWTVPVCRDREERRKIYASSSSLDDIPQQTQEEIDEFFSTYKNLEEGKEVETLGWEDKQAAMDAIEHAQDLYDEHFN